MKTVRFALATALGASLAVPAAVGLSTASAAAPVCNLVTDPKGDAAIVTDQPGMDIVSGDIVTTAKSVTAVIRLADKPNTVNPEAAGSSRYYFEFRAPGSDNAQFLRASIAFPTGAVTYSTGEITPSASGSTFTNDPASPDVTGKIDGNVITITAKFSALTRIKPEVGKKIRDLNVETFALAGVLLIPVDDAASTKTYTGGAASCVQP